MGWQRNGSRHPPVGVLWIVAIALIGCATPIEEQRWIRVRSAHFELFSGASPAVTRQIAESLELFRAALISITNIEGIEPRVPTWVYIFGDTASFRTFRRRSSVQGFMIPTPHGNFLAVNADRRRDAVAIAYHEFVHFVLRNESALRYPAWYDEGLAELLSTTSISGDQLQVGGIPPTRAPWLLYGNPLSLRRVMTASGIMDWSEHALGMFYAQAWALTHFLHGGHHMGFPARHAEMRRYLELVGHDASPEEACEQAFGSSFEELETDFLRYISGNVPILGMPISSFAYPRDVSLQPLPEAEKLYRLGELAFALGDRPRAEGFHHAAAEQDPSHARALASLGLLRAGPDSSASEPLLARALELGHEDATVLRLAAGTLVEQAARTQPGEARARLLEQARARYRRSLELDPSQVAPYLGISRTYGESDADLDSSIAALEEAHRRLPSHQPTSLALSQLYLRRDRQDEARKLLRSAATRPHGESLRDADRSALQQLMTTTGLSSEGPLSTRHLEARLDVESPNPGAMVRGLVNLAEVRGRGGLWEATLHDVVIAIDESSSTLAPTGQDVDGDGVIGQARRKPQTGSWSILVASDPDDSIIAAELRAARTLIERFDPETTRVAVLTFAVPASVKAPLGPPSQAVQALEDYRVHVDTTATSLSNALVASLEELVRGREPTRRRQRSIILLSDGIATYPGPRTGAQDALEAAELLGKYGVRVHAFALGTEAIEGGETYRAIAERSGGRFVPVVRPGDVVSHLADLRLTGLRRVSMHNQRLDEAGRAVRILPDGSFDGFVPLAVGANEIEVVAEIEGRPPMAVRRTVFYDRPLEPTARDEAEGEALLRTLRDRTVAIELFGEIQRRKEVERATRKDLVIDVEQEESGDP